MKKVSFVSCAVVALGLVASGLPSTAGETIGYNRGTQTVFLKEINSSSDCYDLGRELGKDRDALNVELSQCYAASEPQEVVWVEYCGNPNNWTVFPNCLPTAIAACERSDYVRERLAHCYKIAKRQEADRYRRVALAIEGKLVDLNDGRFVDGMESAYVMSRTLNRVRKDGTATNRLSRRLSGLALRGLNNRGRLALAELDKSFDEFDGSFSAENPVPDPSQFSFPEQYSDLQGISDAVLEKDFDLLFQEQFASDPEIRDLLQELAVEASYGNVDFSETYTKDDVIALMQSIPPGDKYERERAARNGLNKATKEWTEAALRQAMATKLQGIQSANSGVSSPGGGSTQSNGKRSLVFSNFQSANDCKVARQLFDSDQLSGVRSHLTFMSDAHWDCCAQARNERYQGGTHNPGLVWAYEVLCGTYPARSCILGRDSLCPYRPIGAVPPFPN